MATNSEEHDDCHDTIERLYHYLDGELTDERRAEIRQHLDDCPPCFDAYDFESELRVVIARRCQERVPDSLLARIRAALAAEDGGTAARS
ncbi:MAG: mycothiol system anti-sigma-R factor [Acidimicrobiales bacterium]